MSDLQASQHVAYDLSVIFCDMEESWPSENVVYIELHQPAHPLRISLSISSNFNQQKPQDIHNFLKLKPTILHTPATKILCNWRNSERRHIKLVHARKAGFDVEVQDE